MKDLILFLLGVSGISIVVTMTRITEPFRNLFKTKKSKPNKLKELIYYLLNCPICLSVWAGLFMVYMHDYHHEAFRYIAYSFGSVSGLYWLTVYRKL